MAITSIRADIGVGGANGIVFLGGTTALNMLGEVSAGCSVPDTWKGKLNAFLACKDGQTFTLGGHEIIRTGFYVKVKELKFTETEHGDKGPAYWELANKVSGIPKAELASTMRAVLASPGTACDPWVATLTAAMFLSEVSRNPRSFMINLMLLDLIQGGVKYGSAANKELDFNKLLKFDGGNTGKTKQYDYSTGSVTVGRGAESGTVRGGKLPMSQLGAMEQYQNSVDGFEYKKNFDAYASQSRLNLDAPANAGTGYHFSSALLEKECTVSMRWLLASFGKSPMNHRTGSVEVEQTLKAVWGNKPTTVKLQQDVTVPVALTGLRTHVRQVGWVDADTADARAKTVVAAVRQALRLRQSGVAMLL